MTEEEEETVKKKNDVGGGGGEIPLLLLRVVAVPPQFFILHAFAAAFHAGIQVVNPIYSAVPLLSSGSEFALASSCFAFPPPLY